MQHHGYDLLQNFLPNSKTFWEVSSRLPPLFPPLRSCHPSHISKNIPYNLCYRLLGICSNRETLEIRLKELKNLLLLRG